MRVLPIVVAVVVGIATSAVAEVSENRIERARKGALDDDYQEELPGGRLVQFEMGGPGRQGSGAGPGSGSGTSVRVVPGPGSGSGSGSGVSLGQGSGSGSGTGAGLGPGSGSGSGSGGTAGVPKPGSGSASAGSGSSANKRAHDRRMGKRDPNRERQDTREYRQRDEDGAFGGLFNVLLWGLLAVGIGLLVIWFVSELSKSGDDAALPAEDSKDAKVAAQTAAIIEKPLDDADVLAQQGKYVEAIHTLLLRTLHELARSAMVRVERSHTSREILARVPLLADARDALSVLITYVELTHFGDEPASETDYVRCREQFNRFAEAFRAGLAVQQRMPKSGGTALAR